MEKRGDLFAPVLALKQELPRSGWDERGASLITARTAAEAFAVVEILVVGADLGNGFRSVAPGAYFMLVKIDERAA